MTNVNQPQDINAILRQMAERIQRLESQIVHGFDSGWITPTLLNGWVDYGSGWETARFRKKNGIVYLRGLIKNGSTSATIFQLPPGFRPGGDTHSPALATAVVGIVNVLANGDVKHNTGPNGWFSLQIPPFPSDN